VRRWAGLVAALALSAPAVARAAEPVTEDVERFYRLYDATGGNPSVEQLDAYIAAGTPAFKAFARLRNVTGARMAATLAAQRAVYADARRCLAVLPAVKTRVAKAFARLVELHPEAKQPPVTIVVGRGRPVGMTYPDGVAIGLEALCAAHFMNPDLEDRFVHVIAHEYVHIQQPEELDSLEPGQPGATVARMSMKEGAAEFVSQLISGGVSQHQHVDWTKGKEAAIEAAFLRDLDKTDLSDWLFNGPGDPAKPGDLGYWVGARISKAYYDRATDKRQALRDILEMRDPKAFIAASGWKPAAP
jgi:hypothetical protein